MILQPEYFLNDRACLYGGDNREALKLLDDNSIDSIVTDPPYALVSIVKRFGSPNAAPAKGNAAYMRASAGFMGQTWDTGDTAHDVAFWAECMRVLKPGGYLLAFGGTRTYHRLACAIEDAGFEVRDMVSWIYGSGFPKSHDVAVAIDKAEKGFPHGGRVSDSPNAGKFKTQATEGKRSETDSGQQFGAGPGQFMLEQTKKYERDLCETAKKWRGYGTALKPALEPICMARKPLSEKTVAANVLKWGTGAINVDGCRVPINSEVDDPRLGGNGTWSTEKMAKNVYEGGYIGERVGSSPLGRWPANVIHDGSDEVLEVFPDSKGQQGDVRGTEPSHTGDENTVCYGEFDRVPFTKRNDSGSAARFFYCAKANKKDRAGSKHPTVKPVNLIRYLCRMVTPPGGMVLDPFAGSGTTAEAAHLEGFHCILMERETQYLADIRRRLEALDDPYPVPLVPTQTTLDLD